MYKHNLPAFQITVIATTRVHPPTWTSPVSVPASPNATQGHFPTKFIAMKVLCFSTIYMSSIIGRSQVSECLKIYEHLQPPDAAAFSHVDVILS